MIISKQNKFNGKWYTYDTQIGETSLPMFDEALHNPDNAMTDIETYPKKCGFCHTSFSSRNKLFYHLGFHNIDIRQWWEKSSENHETWEDYLEKKRKRKKKKHNKFYNFFWTCRWRGIQKKTKCRSRDDYLSDLINKIKV